MSYVMTIPNGLGLREHQKTVFTDRLRSIRKYANTPINPGATMNGVSNPAGNQQVQPNVAANNKKPTIGSNNSTAPQQQPHDFFTGLGDMWNFLIARIKMWWYQNRIKSGNLTADQWKTVHNSAKELSTNRFGRAMGKWINPNKYTDSYFNGLPRFISGVQAAHNMRNGVFSDDDEQMTKDRANVGFMRQYGTQYGYLDDAWNKEYGDKINLVTNPGINNSTLRTAGKVGKIGNNISGLFNGGSK